MAKIIVEIDMGKGSGTDLMKMMEDHKEAFFPVGQNMLAVNKGRMTVNPVDENSYMFRLLGVVDEKGGEEV